MRHATVGLLSLLLTAILSVTTAVAPLSPATARGDDGVITGTVTRAGSTDGMVEVKAYLQVSSSRWKEVGYTTLMRSGSYELTGLPVGTYRLKFHDRSGVHALEYHADATTLETARDVVVASGATVRVDGHLDLGGHITGTITDATGKPLHNVYVTPYQREGCGLTWAEGMFEATDEQGRYDLGGLQPGTYRVGYVDYSGASNLREFHHDAASLETATSIVVGTGATVSGVDAQLAAGTRVSGRILRTNGTPQPGGAISAYTRKPGSSTWTYVTNGVVHPTTGTYKIGLLPGTYRFLFSSMPESDGTTYNDEYYSDAATLGAAETIAVGTEPIILDDVVLTAGPNLGEAWLQGLYNTTEITGAHAPRVGTTLRVRTPLTKQGRKVTTKFRWYAGKKAIKKATKRKLKVTRKLRGKRLSVRVTSATRSAKLSQRFQTCRVQ
jgi:hypothetical protein